MNHIKFFILALMATIVSASGCKEDKKDNKKDIDTPNSLENTVGFGLLNKVKGIWNGSVSSTTYLGSYPEWIVDFRPISENQVSAKNELDTLNDIFMSFFIAKYNNQYRVAFRNGGSFGGVTRVSYFLADSVSETSALAYYRFSEIIKGKNRAFTEVMFKSDSLIIKSFTNKLNSLAEPVLHMQWRAKLQDTTSCFPAVAAFNFPKKSLTKDFSTALNGVQEAIFYSVGGGADPYPESEQPYLGKANISYNVSGFTPDPAKNVFILITTQPLISGFAPNLANMKYRSRYVILNANNTSHSFNYMHPGTYFLYALYDADGNKTFSSGDWVSTSNTTFTLGSKEEKNSTTTINFKVP